MVTVDLGEEVAMNRSPSSLDPIRPLSPADLRSSGGVPAGAALVCAESAIAGRADPVAGILVRHGWTSLVAVDRPAPGHQRPFAFALAFTAFLAFATLPSWATTPVGSFGSPAA